jgi:hypothetical protein
MNSTVVLFSQAGVASAAMTTLAPVPGASWGKCNICKKPIEWGGAYLKCTVSTCNRKRFQLYFCTDSCWDAHNPDFNHRSPGYTEHVAPAKP